MAVNSKILCLDNYDYQKDIKEIISQMCIRDSYVIAAAQTGVKPAYTAYGNSMLIDPWGKVLVLSLIHIFGAGEPLIQVKELCKSFDGVDAVSYTHLIPADCIGRDSNIIC